MRTAEVKVPITDEDFFSRWCQQMGYEWKWLTERVPDFQEDDP